MKKLYTNRIVTMEQFTDDFTPKGVMIADPIFRTVLVPSLQKALEDSIIYLFKYPKPDISDREVAKLYNVPFPFTWIHKGDYVVTSTSGYSRVVTKEEFERDYKEIEIKIPDPKPYRVIGEAFIIDPTGHGDVCYSDADPGL